MKKLMLMLMVVAMAAPLYAQGRVQFVATDNEDGTCTITFDANDVFDVQPVAMGVEVKVNGSESAHLITAVSGMASFYEIFMDYAYDDPCSYTYGAGHPVADPCGPGSAELPSHYFTVSMGGLGGAEDPEQYPVPDNGVAFILTAGNLTDPCDQVTGVIKINHRRGGVIGNDTEPMETNLDDPAKQGGGIPFKISPYVPPEECMRETHTDYSDWKNLSGMIDCWCYCKQCNGDASGQSAFGGAVAVFQDDEGALMGAYGNPAVATTPGDPGWCADFNHKAQFGGAVRVFDHDLLRFIPNYGSPSTKECSGPNCSGPNLLAFPVTGCDTSDLPNSEFNFWLYAGLALDTYCPNDPEN